MTLNGPLSITWSIEAHFYKTKYARKMQTDKEQRQHTFPDDKKVNGDLR